MIRLLAKLLIPDRENLANGGVRRAWGSLCGALGVALNLLLFAGKYAAGLLTGSIALTADAVNNLSDGATSLVTLLGFRLAGRRPDREHPFGHGRAEYIAALAVAVAIVLMGAELLRSAVGRLMSPREVALSPLGVGALAVSIAVKLYMYAYNRDVGRRIRSGALTAAAADSLADAGSSGAVLAGMAVKRCTGIELDAWCGLLVALLVLRTGVSVAREALRPLLGGEPDPELVAQIKSIVLAHPQVVGIHDLVVHDYGPGRLMVTLHGEVAEDARLREIHEVIDHIERRLREELGCDAVIHMDPIATADAEVARLRSEVEALAAEIDPGAAVHDFRVVEKKLIFDMVLPLESPLTEAEAAVRMEALAAERLPGKQAVVHIDKGYTP